MFYARGDLMAMTAAAAKAKIMKLVKFSMVFWIVGLLMILSALYMEFFGSFAALADNTSSRLLMSLKLGGVGLTLSGIYLTLVAIVKILSMMPDRLGAVIKKKK
jgi:hypothetical protein